MITVEEEGDRTSVPELSGGFPNLTLPRPPSPSRPLSASARTLIRKYVTEKTPPSLPAGHATVVFNEQQVHSVPGAVSDETVITFLHLIKSILEEAMRIGARFREGTLGPSRQRVHCFRGRSPSSVGDGSQSEDGTGGYTSGALSSDDDFASFDLQEPRPSPSTETCKQDRREQDAPTSLASNIMPRPGYIAADNEPLATLFQQLSAGPSFTSPPRKRRKTSCRAG